MKIIYPVLLKDTLNNLLPTSGANEDYQKGIVVGVVGALMSTGMSYKEAITQVAIHMPDDGKKPVLAFPEAWLKDITAAREKHRKLQGNIHTF